MATEVQYYKKKKKPLVISIQTTVCCFNFPWTETTVTIYIIGDKISETLKDIW